MFTIDDIVRLKSGHAPQTILYINTSKGLLRCRYLSDTGSHDGYAYEEDWRRADDYIHHENYTEHNLSNAKQGESPIMTDKSQTPELYQTNETKPRFGTFLAKNSMGQMVLEIKGTGEVVAFNEDQIEVVMPYTVNLQPVDKNAPSIHVTAVKGQVKKDDILIQLDTGILWMVTVLDSKSRTAKPNKSKWLKVDAKKLTFG